MACAIEVIRARWRKGIAITINICKTTVFCGQKELALPSIAVGALCATFIDIHDIRRDTKSRAAFGFI